MRTNTAPMACGNCGNGLFRVYFNSATGPTSGLLVECNACGPQSITEVAIHAPRLDIRIADESTGCLAPMTPSGFR